MNLQETAAPQFARADIVDANFATVVAAIEAIGTGSIGLNVKDFGAVGDGVTDDTVAMQAALDALTVGASLELVSGCTYAVTNLKVPNKTNDWRRSRIYSNGTATIKRIAGGDDSYMLASERWLTTSIYPAWACSPITWENIIFDADWLCDYAFVNKSYGSEFHHCRFDNALIDGCLFTRRNQDGSIGTTAYLANTKFISCDGGGNGGYWLRTQGTATDDTDGPSDGHIVECQPDCGDGAGCIYLATAAGWTIRGNHTFAYSGAQATVAEVYIASMGNSGPIIGNTFEGLVKIGKVGNKTALLGPGNNFWWGVMVEFANDTTNETISIIGNTFSKNTSCMAAVITHANNRAQKVIVSDNVFESASPHTLAAGVTAGVYLVINCVSGKPAASFDRLAQVWIATADVRAKADSGYRDVRAISGANSVGMAVDNNNAYLSTFNNIPLKLQSNATDRIELTTNGLVKFYGVPDHSSDSAAAAGGVPVNGLYRTGSSLRIRIS